MKRKNNVSWHDEQPHAEAVHGLQRKDPEQDYQENT